MSRSNAWIGKGLIDIVPSTDCTSYLGGIDVFDDCGTIVSPISSFSLSCNMLHNCTLRIRIRKQVIRMQCAKNSVICFMACFYDRCAYIILPGDTRLLFRLDTVNGSSLCKTFEKGPIRIPDFITESVIDSEQR